LQIIIQVVGVGACSATTESSFFSYLSSLPAHLGRFKDGTTAFVGANWPVIKETFAAASMAYSAKQAYDNYYAPASKEPPASMEPPASKEPYSACLEACTRLAETCFNNAGTVFNFSC
jgi:hypothetical protein